jgi:hypothetical protein
MTSAPNVLEKNRAKGIADLAERNFESHGGEADTVRSNGIAELCAVPPYPIFGCFMYLIDIIFPKVLHRYFLYI